MIEGKDGASHSGVLSYGMVGGGPGSFIGDVHRKAAAFDGMARLVAGAFSRNYEGTVATGQRLGLEAGRLYRSYEEMAAGEGRRSDKIDFVSIVTPNNTHYKAARAFLAQGIHVVCEKPLATTPGEAMELAAMARDNGLLLCVTYVYSGFPLVKQAREMVRRGDLGEIRVVMGEYPQDWLAVPLERSGQKQAAWRTDPAQAGLSNCVGDLGSHIEHTVAYITGLRVAALAAKLDIFGEGRQLDDNAEVLLRYANGASGVYWSSQIAIGHDNGLKVRVYGAKGSLAWEQENPNYLRVAMLGQPPQMLTRGGSHLCPEAAGMTRIPPGHPEGYYEAFANIYSAFAAALLKRKSGQPLTAQNLDFPDAEAGVSGVRFIGKCVESAKAGAVWVTM